MKKLQLNLDALRVDSFETSKELEARGTVRGHVETSCGEPCTCDCEATTGGGFTIAAPAVA